ncbi:MAG: amidase [Pseudomonadota bacterium]
MWRWIGRIFLGLFGFVVLALAGVIVWNWEYSKAFPDILSAFTAKEYCTCRYVIGRGDAACRQYTKYFIPISQLRFDDESQTVEVDALFRSNSARYLSEREGCRLD